MYVHGTYVHMWGANSGITLRELERLCLYVVCLSPAKLNCKRFAGVNLWNL